MYNIYEIDLIFLVENYEYLLLKRISRVFFKRYVCYKILYNKVKIMKNKVVLNLLRVSCKYLFYDK